MKRLFSFFVVALVALAVVAQQVQVWDLGAQQLAGVQNMLCEAEINSWYPATVEVGSVNNSIGNIIASDSCNFSFYGASKTNHRLRTTNENLTCYDRKSLKDADGNVYTGYIYSNASSTPEVFIEQEFQVGDQVDYYVGSNGNPETYVFQSPSGQQVEAKYTAAAKIEKLTFFVGENGKYRLYGTDEKLVVARIVRTPALNGTLQGKVIAPKSIPDTYQLVFTNVSNGHADTIAPQGDSYSVTLPLNYDYAISLAGANGYVVATPSQVSLTESNQTLDIEIEAVSLSSVSGLLVGLTDEELKVVELVFARPADRVFVPQMTIDRLTGEYSLILESGVTYSVEPLFVNDYMLEVATIAAQGDVVGHDIQFVLKPRYAVTLLIDELYYPELFYDAQFVFTNLNEKGYVYKFKLGEDILLRDGVYDVKVDGNIHYLKQMLTSNLVVNGGPVSKVIEFSVDGEPDVYPYYSELYVVGAEINLPLSVEDNQRFTSINSALAAIRQMERKDGERVTIYIEPGNYEEMLKINVADLTLRNLSVEPSIELKNGGVDIAPSAVRITSYYGHGYNYASMGKDFFWDERTLQVNKENGYPSVVNVGGSSTTYWNTTVLVSAKNFEAYDIIFENSYNQYVSKKELEDVLYEIEGASKGERPKDAGNTSVQNRSFRERACAIAFTSSADRAYLENCRVVGRQDAFYGDQGARVAVQGGVLMGACDYIFGGMTLVCHQTELAMLVSDDKNDVAYLTAAKQDAGVRGYLFYDCHVTSAQPEIDMVEKVSAKPGYWGRPWSGTAETVFFNTLVDESQNASYKGQSLILASGWNDGLTAGGSPRSYEYGTQEVVDNSAKRQSWATVLNDTILPDGTKITLYDFTKGKDGWNPFHQVISNLPSVKDSQLEITIVAADGQVSLSFSDGAVAQTSLSVYDLSGREVASRTFVQSVSLPLATGMYILSLEQGGVKENFKIII